MEKERKQNAKDLAREISELPGLLFARMKFGFFENSDMTPPQMAVVMHLEKLNEPLRMSELSERMGTSMPTMTGIISRLVDKGFVKRGDYPKDRRVVTVEITPKGKNACDQFLQGVQQVWLPVLNKLDESERKNFIEILRKVKSHLEKVEGQK